MMSILDEIRAKTDALTKKQRCVAQYILDNPDEASYLSLKELSLRTCVSEVSVLRVCKALGYESFIALKEALREHTKDAFRTVTLPAPSLHPDNRTGATPEQLLKMVCADEQNNLISTISQLDTDKLVRCVHELLKAERIFVFGHDRTYVFADYLCYRLNFLRIQATAVQLGEGNTVSTTLAGIQSGDVVILMSFPPYHEPISNIVSFCRYRNVPVITITDTMSSPAAEGADCVFLCRTSARYFYNSQVATLSFINILTSSIAIEMGGKFDDILSTEQDVSDFLYGFANMDKNEKSV